jgi:hypothetical protein
MTVKFWSVVGLLCMVLALAISATAQDTGAPCSVDDVLNTEFQGMVQRDWLESVIVTLNANIEDDDAANFLSTARELRSVLGRLEARCRGLSFSSEVDGAQPVIGPITFPDGVWKGTFTVNGVASVEMETLSGTCKSGYLFVATEGDGTDGAEAIYKTEDNCETLISVTHVHGEWTLDFELIKASE